MIYFVQMGEGGPIKIGYFSCPRGRVKSLSNNWPYEPIVLSVVVGDRCAEREIFKSLKDYRLRGEWFKPATEVFDFIRNYKGLKVKYQSEMTYRITGVSRENRKWRKTKMIEAVVSGKNLHQVAEIFGVVRASTVRRHCRKFGVPYPCMKKGRPPARNQHDC